MEQSVSFDVLGKTIRGVLHSPDNGGTDKPGVVLCHGFTGNKIGLHRILVKAARVFCRSGFHVLRFDFSGCGDSDGEHWDITIDGQVLEALAATDFLGSQPGVRQDAVFLAGLSMGAAVAALAARRATGLAGLVLWAPVANLYEDIRGIVGGDIFTDVWATGFADFKGFELGKQFLESLQRNHPLISAREFAGAAFIVHGTWDEEVPIGNAGLYRETRTDLPYETDVYLVEGADHTFSAAKWENEVFEVTANWLKQHFRD